MNPPLKLIFIVLLILSTLSYAQLPTSKGVYRLSGSIGLSYRAYSTQIEDLDESFFNFNFSPGYSLFVMDNFEAGVNLSYTYYYHHVSKIIPGFERGGYNQSLSIAPEIRYYLPTEKVIPFIGTGASFGSNVSLTLFKYLHLVSFSAIGGIDYLLSKNVAIETAIIYNHYTSDYLPNGINEIQLGVGINYFIF